MPLRHSTPARPASTLRATKASQSSPAATERRVPCCSIPHRATRSTRPLKPASEISTLLPPPSTKRRRERACANATAASMSASVLASANHAAGPPISNVVNAASGTLRWNSIRGEGTPAGEPAISHFCVRGVWSKSASGMLARSFCPQCPDGVDARSIPGGQQTRKGRDNKQRCAYDEVNRSIERMRINQQRFHKLRDGCGRDQAKRQTGQCRLEPVGQHQTEHFGSRRAKRDAHTDLGGALGDQ